MQTRENALHHWLKTIYPSTNYSLVPLAGDASFRRYYRVTFNGLSLIVMDSPPDKINLAPFIQMRTVLAKLGIETPEIHQSNATLGFALLEDLGDTLFSEALTPYNPILLYPTAIQVLIQLQQHPKPHQLPIPVFNQTFMLQELALFNEWFLQRYLGLRLTPDEVQLIHTTFQQLTHQIAAQPQVLVHRDFHSRNIMILEPIDSTQHQLGIIDFQDAVLGPLTYDLVSLLKDCYIQLSFEQLHPLLQYFYAQSPVAQQYPFAEFQRAFDLCGLQRHLRILGTFCRLHLRDAKSNYLNDLPRTFEYVIHCIDGYAEFERFGRWLNQRVEPCFKATLL